MLSTEWRTKPEMPAAPALRMATAPAGREARYSRAAAAVVPVSPSPAADDKRAPFALSPVAAAAERAARSCAVSASARSSSPASSASSCWAARAFTSSALSVTALPAETLDSVPLLLLLPLLDVVGGFSSPWSLSSTASKSGCSRIISAARGWPRSGLAKGEA